MIVIARVYGAMRCDRRLWQCHPQATRQQHHDADHDCHDHHGADDGATGAQRAHVLHLQGGQVRITHGDVFAPEGVGFDVRDLKDERRSVAPLRLT
jgi:hypothetical protein